MLATASKASEPCLAGKMHANPFPSSENRTTEVLELVHSDVHDVGIISHGGHRYWISFIDDSGRFKVVVPMKHKVMHSRSSKGSRHMLRMPLERKSNDSKMIKGGNTCQRNSKTLWMNVELQGSIPEIGRASCRERVCYAV